MTVAKKKTKKKTAGELALDSQKKKDENHDSIELQREIHKGSNSEKSYEEEVWETVDRARKDSAIEKDFYITVLFKKERHLQNIVRQYFFYRQSCPTPEFDQTVYKYHRKEDELEYMWTVPNNATTLNLTQMLEEGTVPKEQETLAFMCEAFLNGQLNLYSMKLNKELPK